LEAGLNTRETREVTIKTSISNRLHPVWMNKTGGVKMKSIIRRLSIVEKNIGTCIIPEKERIIVIPYPAGHEEEFKRLTQESVKRLKEKYGPNISDNDLLIIGIRKFYRQEKEASRT
jgi:hypothetical protein